MVAAAPASTPHVGWLTIRTPGSRRISRPTMNFCKLPPDRLTASGSRLALRTSKPAVARSTAARVADLSIKPRLTMPLAAWPVSKAFSDNFIRGAVPFLRYEGRAHAATFVYAEHAGRQAVDHDSSFAGRQTLSG